MRLAGVALAAAVIVIALVLALRARTAPVARPPTPEQTAGTVAERAAPAVSPAVRAPGRPSPPSPPAPGGARAPSAAAGAPADLGADEPAPGSWQARHEERDFAYWDFKLTLLRKVDACVGDRLGTRGAAQLAFHFKRDGAVWTAARAELDEPSDYERDKLGAVDFRGDDRALVDKCVNEAFAGQTMPVTGGTEDYAEYTLHGQIRFPTRDDIVWQKTGVPPPQ